jgi:hypothetical protein
VKFETFRARRSRLDGRAMDQNEFLLKRTRKSNGPFLLRSLAVTLFPELAEGLSKETEVFFEEVQCPFPESRAASPNE